jgi:hypothetical protein
MLSEAKHLFILTRKVGGGYIFIHRMLMEQFANLTAQDIEQLADTAHTQ